MQCTLGAVAALLPGVRIEPAEVLRRTERSEVLRVRAVRPGWAEPQMLIGRGYYHNYVLRKSRPGALELAARISDPASGRTLELSTTEPGVQVYSSNNLAGGAVNVQGLTMRATDGLALETQHFPDSPNQSGFPSTLLRPGEILRSTTVFRFLNG